MTTTQPEWVSIPEAAQRLDVSPDTIRRMISRGEIDARRFGPRLIRINWSSIADHTRPLRPAARVA